MRWINVWWVKFVENILGSQIITNLFAPHNRTDKTDRSLKNIKKTSKRRWEEDPKISN